CSTKKSPSQIHGKPARGRHRRPTLPTLAPGGLGPVRQPLPTSAQPARSRTASRATSRGSEVSDARHQAAATRGGCGACAGVGCLARSGRSSSGSLVAGASPAGFQGCPYFLLISSKILFTNPLAQDRMESWLGGGAGAENRRPWACGPPSRPGSLLLT